MAAARRKPNTHAKQGPQANPDAASTAGSRAARWPFSLRDTIRLALAASLVIALIQYVRFWMYVQSGAGSPVARPNVADAFLPLAGLAGLKTWLSTGYFDVMHPVAIVVLIAIVLTAWIFRRAACSWLCPIGIVSEFLGKVGERVFGKAIRVPKWIDRPLIWIKYLGTFLLLLWVLGAPAGSVRAFLQTPFYAVADTKLFDVFAQSGVTVFAIIGALLLVSIPIKSAWCRYLCPYGALQGLFGVLSPVVLSKNDASCNGCGTCSRACPNCVDVAGAKGAVVSAECMGCGSCVEACPRKDTLAMKVAGRRHVDVRTFALAFCGVFVAVIAVAVVTGHFGSGLPPQDYRAILHISTDVHLPF